MTPKITQNKVLKQMPGAFWLSSALVHFILFASMALLSRNCNQSNTHYMNSKKTSQQQNVIWTQSIVSNNKNKPKSAKPVKAIKTQSKKSDLPSPNIAPKQSTPNKATKKMLKKTLTSAKKPKKILKPNKAPTKSKDTISETDLNNALASLSFEKDIQRPKLENFQKQAEDSSSKSNKNNTSDSKEADLVAGDNASQYQTHIDKSISNNFFWLKEQELYLTEISFFIDSDGNLSQTAVHKSSGNTQHDMAALRAVRKSSPLDKPPLDSLDYFTKQQIVVKIGLAK